MPGFGFGPRALARRRFVAPGLPVPAPSFTTQPSTSGSPRVGQSITGIDGTIVGGAASARRWLLGGSAISGATGGTYVPVAGDAGGSLVYEVTATGAGGSTIATAPALTVLPLAPVNTIAPALSGTAAVGQTLATSTGTWSNSPTGYTYQWRRDGVDLAGATMASYAVVAGDVGHNITCRVTATNAGGGAGATSNALAATLAAYTGPVANRFYFPSAATGTGNVASTVGLYWTDTASSVQILIPTSFGYADAPQTANATYHARVEYPAGTFTEVKWGGAATVTTVGGTSLDTGVSDALALSVAKGDLFKLHVYASAASGTIAVAQGTGSSIRSTAMGDASILGGGIDLTATGIAAGSDGGSGAFLFPLVLATTTQPSFAAIGDSTTLGSKSAPTAIGQTGEIAQSFDKSYAVLNLGVGGSQLYDFNRSGQQRAKLAGYASHIVNHYSKNDFQATSGGGRAAAVLQGDWDAFPYWFVGSKVLIGATVGPVTNGTNTTTDTNNVARVALNTYINGAPSPYAGAPLATGEFMEQGSTGLWKTGYTDSGDGLHGNATSYPALAASGTIVPATLAARAAVAFFNPLTIRVAKRPLIFVADNASLTPASGTTLAALGAVGTMTGTSTVSQTGFGGLPGVGYNGTSQYMVADAASKAFSSGAAAITLAGLFIPTAIPASDKPVLVHTIAGSNADRAGVWTNAGKLKLFYRRLDTDSVSSIVGTSTTGAGGAVLFVGVFDPTGNVVQLWVNGVLEASGSFSSSGAFPATASNNIAITGISSTYTAMTVNRVASFDKALTTAERQKIEGAFAWAGGQAALLPGGHPYRSARPTG